MFQKFMKNKLMQSSKIMSQIQRNHNTK